MRWIGVVVASTLIHLVALDALPTWTPDAPDTVDSQPLRAVLMPAPVATPPSPPPEAEPAPVQPRPRSVPRPRRVAPSAPVASAPDPIEAAVPASITADAPPSTPPAPEARAPEPPAPAPAPAPAPPTALPPASAHLAYEVVYVDRKNPGAAPYYGIGSIDWATDGVSYHADLKAGVDFLLFKVNVLALHSEGSVNALGVAPDRYTETPRRRSTVATNFNRDQRQSITFSASSNTAPLVDGVQDRLSVLFQIGGLLRADATRATAGRRIEVPVAGVRGDVEPWTFEAVGVESIAVGFGTIATAHLRRAPRPESRDAAIDVWIAFESGGYPARVLYTEPNGSTTEMTLKDITGSAAGEVRPPAPGSASAPAP